MLRKRRLDICTRIKIKICLYLNVEEYRKKENCTRLPSNPTVEPIVRRSNQVWLQRSMLVWTKRNKLYITKKKNHTIGQTGAKKL